ncbi:MAG: hypothetical protein HY554_02270 [Elusimicrobia bacterium]|nr:hypothetical protein [Elusimicrobiota bacterium]
MGIWAGLLFFGSLPGAGPVEASSKSNGEFVVVDDSLAGSAAGAELSGGGSAVTGAISASGSEALVYRETALRGGFLAFPFPFSRLLLVVPGETPAPGAPAGKEGAPLAQVAGATFSATVYATDWFYQALEDVSPHVVRLSTLTAPASPLPPPQTLASGRTIFSGLSVAATGAFVLEAADSTDPAIAASASDLRIAPPAASSPTVHMNVADGGVYASLGGGLSGTASDPTGVQRVRLAVRRLSPPGLYFDAPPAEAFTLASRTFFEATLGRRAATSTTWFFSLPDASLAEGERYEVELLAENPSGLRAPSVSTFTFDARGLAYGRDDGRASAAALPASAPGCAVLTATVTVTLAGVGVSSGGAVALRLPAGWSLPASVTAGAPAEAGEVRVLSTASAVATPGWSRIVLNPPAFGEAPLGDGWILVEAATGTAGRIAPGEDVAFVVRALPPLGLRGRGRQTFEARTQASSAGTLAAIAAPPSIELAAGAAAGIAFVDPSPIALGPLQASPTVQVQSVDLCGNPAPPPATMTVGLSAGGLDAAGGFVADVGAAFFSEGGGTAFSLSIVPPATRPPAPGGFYYRTTRPGPDRQYLRLTADAPVSEALRFVDLRPSPVALTAVSIDTGTSSPGASSATLRTGESAVIRFALADPEVPWELRVSTSPADFEPAVFAASGYGDALRPLAVSWNGLDAVSVPARSAGPGTYHVLIRAGGGAAEHRGLRVLVAPSAWVRGQLGAAGAGALVRAEGPGAGPGSFAVASATGAFAIFGLRAGERYRVAASTRAVALGQPVELSTGASGVVASEAGGDAGALAFAAMAFLRVRAALPVPASAELLGSAFAHNADYTRLAFGNLHFDRGAATSDSGSKAFGQSASTWTVLAVAPGAYDLELAVPELGISTTVAGQSLAAGQVRDLAVVFSRKAAVYGYAVLPATRSFGTWVSVQAQRPGDRFPAAFAGAFATGSPAPRSSAAFSLFGLDPGTWTVTARAPGFLSTAAVLAVGSEDVGRPDAPATGLALPLGLGGAIQATVRLEGDTRALPRSCSGAAAGACPDSGFVLFVEAYHRGTFAASRAPVLLSTSPAFASASVELAGLESGPHLLRAYLPGFQLEPAGGALVEVSTPAVSAASITLRADDARLGLDVRLRPLPGGACYSTAALQDLGFFVDLLPEAAPRAGGDLSALAAASSVHCSSLSVTSPALSPGPRRVWALSASSGSSAFQTASLVHGATSVLVVDLSGPVYAVTGTVSLSGRLALPKPDGQVVSVSSASGLLAHAARADYCLLSSSAPVSLTTARVELIPVSAGARSRSGASAAQPPEPPGPLLRAEDAGGDCRDYRVPGALLDNGLPDPSFRLPALAAYIGRVQADGSFRIASVPAGAYWLRNVPDLDLDPANGLEAAEHQALVRVAGDGSVGAVPLDPGWAIRGQVLAPPGLPAGRPLLVALFDAEGRTLKAAALSSDGGRVPYAFERAAPGSYAVQAFDLGFPRAYVAAPRRVEVSAADQEGVDLRLVAGGRIQARVAVERARADGSREFALVSASNPELLPSGFQVRAVANPWRQGGFFTARGRNCSEGLCRDAAVDADGRLAVEDVLPGTYDVEFLAAAGGAASTDGGEPLADRIVSGVEVAEGRTADLGTVRLPVAAALTGRVTAAATGRPVANVRVRAVSSAGRPGERSRRRPAPEARSGADGRYALGGLDPETRFYDVTAAPRGREPEGEEPPPYAAHTAAAVDLRGASTLDFSLLDAPFSLSGRVVGAEGRPLASASGEGEEAGARIFLQRVEEIASPGAVADVEALAGIDGRFRVPSLASGTYRVSVSALRHANLNRTVRLTASSADMGTLTLAAGATLSGSVLKPDGSSPGEDEIESVAAATPDLREFLPGAVLRDRGLRSVTGYRIGGFKAGAAYRVLFATARGDRVVPAGAESVVFASTAEARNLDLVFRPPRPFVAAKTRRDGELFRIDFELSQPLRARSGADEALALALATVAARGALSDFELSPDRSRLSVAYAPGLASPGVRESSFSVRLLGWSSERDPDSSDPENPEFLVSSTFSFHLGVDGLRRARVNNFQGGQVQLEADAGRLRFPQGAFAVDASSSVEVALQRSAEALAVSGVRTSAANVASLRYRPSAYPAGLVGAMAATPPAVAPRSAFYDVSLPLGVRSYLTRPVELCVGYQEGVDPAGLNLYWYNQAANAYVLQQDATGAPPRVDAASRARCSHVDHFSTFVLFNSGVSAISGSGFAGSEIEAFAFPNPFDLSVKTVEPIHGLGAQTIRGTMLRFALPSSASGGGRLEIYNVLGERVRSFDLGELAGGSYYYQPWDGRNDAGVDVASGVYLGHVTAGGRSKTFRLAVIK